MGQRLQVGRPLTGFEVQGPLGGAGHDQMDFDLGLQA
jgi:hypothetical protein